MSTTTTAEAVVAPRARAGERYYVVLRPAYWGNRFARPDGTCHTDVCGHLECLEEEYLMTDLAAAAALADRLRDETRRRSEVLEVELTEPWGGLADRPLWRWKKVRVAHAARMPVPAPDSPPRTGEDVWRWLCDVHAAQNDGDVGPLTRLDVTVAELEAACGPGSFARLVAWRRKERRDQITVHTAAVLRIEEVYTDPAATAEWKARYGDWCHHTRTAGEPVQPTDNVYVHYTHIG